MWVVVVVLLLLIHFGRGKASPGALSNGVTLRNPCPLFHNRHDGRHVHRTDDFQQTQRTPPFGNFLGREPGPQQGVGAR